MDPNVFLAFVIATSIMIALPGPSVMLTVAHSISFGWRPAILTVAGATVGIAAQLLIASVGLTSLLHAATEVFAWLRWAGAAYLAYLGVKQWKGAKHGLELDVPSASRVNLFAQGVVVTVANPKSLVFIAAFLPQFMDASRPVSVQLAYIVPTFLLITFSITSVWAIAAGSARSAFRSSRVSVPALRLSGVMMILAGLGMALARRGS